jgi:hypothetical protein
MGERVWNFASECKAVGVINLSDIMHIQVEKLKIVPRKGERRL